MSRLRRAVQRYGQLEEDDDDVQLLDSSVQDDVVLELKASLMRSKQPPSAFINLIIGFVILLNLMLLSIPYYKNKQNRILSLLSVLCSLVNYLILKYERYGLTIGRMKLLILSFVTSIIILAIKSASFQMLDIVYTVPLLNSIGLYTMITNDEDLENEIRSLEKLKYNYKEA